MKSGGKKDTPDTRRSQQEDSSLFQEAMQGVKRINMPDKVVLTSQKAPPASLHKKDDWAVPEDTLSDHIPDEMNWGDDETAFQRPGISRQMLRKLRRGHWKIQAYLDLHGFTRDEARHELVIFLDACREYGYRCVRIIHGKGIGSKDRTPIIKTRIGGWLVQREDVLAFCLARPEDGGSGATLVLLKKSNQRVD